jgi:hypothetical protein
VPIKIEIDPFNNGLNEWCAEDTVRATLMDVDLDVDTNRDNNIDDTDEYGEDNWAKGPGVMLQSELDIS